MITSNPGVPASSAEKFLHLRALLNLELGRMDVFEKQAEEIKAFGKRARIINPGQSAILAVGAIRERPVAEAGQLALRPTLRLTLAVDHRVADGALGALFLKDLRAVLQAPEGLQD